MTNTKNKTETLTLSNGTKIVRTWNPTKETVTTWDGQTRVVGGWETK